MSEQNSDINPAGGSQSLSHSNSDDDGVNSVTKGNLRWKWNEFPVVSRYNLFFLGLSFVVGSVIDVEFSGGYWILLFNTFLMGIGYFLLASSLAEMTSALPFSGGIYGIVRAFIHPFAGFYVACFELLINFFFIALSVHSFSLLPIQGGHVREDMFLMLCLATYIAVVMISLVGGKAFWWSNTAIGVTCLVFLLIYIFGSINHAEFSHWKHQDSEKGFTIFGVMRYLLDPSKTYLGVQYLPLASNFVPEARKDVPFAMMTTVIVVFPLIIAVITIASSIPPGYDILVQEDHPLVFGFSKIFGTSVAQSHFFGFPGLLATCFSFVFCFGKQASTMAGSGLLPSSFSWTLPGFGTPYVPLITISIASFLLNIFGYYYEDQLIEIYQEICCMSICIVFIAFFVAYIRFIDHYSSLERYYRSPFGKSGAILGIGIFGLCFVAVLGFQDSGFMAVGVLLGLSLIIWAIFRSVLHGNHEYSEAEKNELFKAYLITGIKEKD
jgi:amino acid transporter